MQHTRCAIIAVTLLAAAPVAAQPSTPAPTAATEGEDILVVGMGSNGYHLSPDQLRGAVRGFEDYRATYAPAARLIWRFRPDGSGAGVALALKSTAETLPVAIATDGTFTLPHDKLLTGQYRLVTTAAKGAIRIQPWAISPGGTHTQFRFGDARLTCRVMWGFLAPGYSLVQRGLFNMVGGCASSRIGIYFNADKPIAAVAIDKWPRSPEVTSDGKAWHIPLYDTRIGNDDLVRITYRP